MDYYVNAISLIFVLGTPYTTSIDLGELLRLRWKRDVAGTKSIQRGYLVLRSPQNAYLFLAVYMLDVCHRVSLNSSPSIIPRLSEASLNAACLDNHVRESMDLITRAQQWN